MPGQAVRIVAGPFSGMLAKIMEAKSGEKRARILMQALGGGTAKPTQVDVTALEAA